MSGAMRGTRWSSSDRQRRGRRGVEIFNANMRGGKGSPYEGGTRVPSFWRWPKGWSGGVDVGALTSHLDLFPTLARITGATVPEDVGAETGGPGSISPAPESDHRVDRSDFVYPRGRLEARGCGRIEVCELLGSQWPLSLVNHSELYDLKADPGRSGISSANIRETPRSCVWPTRSGGRSARRFLSMKTRGRAGGRIRSKNDIASSSRRNRRIRSRRLRIETILGRGRPPLLGLASYGRSYGMAAIRSMTRSLSRW